MLQMMFVYSVGNPSGFMILPNDAVMITNISAINCWNFSFVWNNNVKITILVALSLYSANVLNRLSIYACVCVMCVFALLN